MPRIYDHENNPLDFCRSCWPRNADEAREALDLPKDWDEGNYECSHPPYFECEGYSCEICDLLLTDKDNGFY